MMGSWAVVFAGTAAAALQVVPAPWPFWGIALLYLWGFLLLAVLGGHVKWALAAALHGRRLAKAPGAAAPAVRWDDPSNDRHSARRLPQCPRVSVPLVAALRPGRPVDASRVGEHEQHRAAESAGAEEPGHENSGPIRASATSPDGSLGSYTTGRTSPTCGCGLQSQFPTWAETESPAGVVK